MGHTHTVADLNEQYKFPKGLKQGFMAMAGVGVLALLIGLICSFTCDNWDNKFWAGILTTGMFGLGIGITGVFFVAAHYVGYGGWYVALKRVPEAMSGAILPMGIVMIVFVIAVLAGMNNIYGWTDDYAKEWDVLIQGKSGFLNNGTLIICTLAFFAIWIGFARLLRKASLQEDIEGGTKWYLKSKKYSAIFLVLLGVTSSIAAWIYLMSVDPHWYSTLYGWYTFASMFVTGIAFMVIVVAILKRQGYLKLVTKEHMHDLGKFMFGFSIFWMYLWTSQFLLIWYANIGEETAYFKVRMENYPVLWYGMLIINFVVPFFTLMRSGAKRKFGSLVTVAVFILIGHFIDFFLMVTPGATKIDPTHTHHYEYPVHFGLFEIGLFIGVLGLIGLVVFKQLAKANLYPVKHPFLGESLEHHT